MYKKYSAVLLSTVTTVCAYASDFARLDEALPTAVDAASIAPVFDFDGDGCLPSAGISRVGDRNGGLNPSGSLTGKCRAKNFLELSNTVHRYACIDSGGLTFCGHFYALYFEKDQLFSGINSGHRHDWEYAAVWTTDGVVTHGSYSAHGDLTTEVASTLPFENGHLKIVYHKDGVATHALRFAKTNEVAENPYRAFVTPTIVSWYEMVGDGVGNQVMRDLLNAFDYGSANLPVTDGRFLSSLNEFKPAEYPDFNDASVFNSNPNPDADSEYSQLVNNTSELCLDIDNAVMANGTNVMQWYCNDGSWQRWHFNPVSGLIRSQQNPTYCLDNSGDYENGANIIIWRCRTDNNNQRFTVNAEGSISVRVQPEQVIDGNGTGAGDNVTTWWNWGGSNQRWTLVP